MMACRVLGIGLLLLALPGELRASCNTLGFTVQAEMSPLVIVGVCVDCDDVSAESPSDFRVHVERVVKGSYDEKWITISMGYHRGRTLGRNARVIIPIQQTTEGAYYLAQCHAPLLVRKGRVNGPVDFWIPRYLDEASVEEVEGLIRDRAGYRERLSSRYKEIERARD